MEILSGLCEKVEEIGLWGPVFTPRTANSACFRVFYAQISEIRANPLKYTDPDGRLQRDRDGNLKYNIVTPDYSAHDSGLGSYNLKINLFADDGTPIEAKINLELNIPELDTDCHGVTFADGKYWINDDQVDLILKGDNYINISKPRKGDIVIYRNADDKVVHSATVVNVKKEHSLLFGIIQWGNDIIEAEGLGGIETTTHRDNVQDAFPSANSFEYYRKERE
jgi:hypothetical protein